MLKLYKRDDGVMRYWEAWSAGNEVTIHWGTVGNRGETREITVAPGRKPAQAITQEAKQPRRDGYRRIPHSRLARIVVQYEIDGMGTPHDRDRRVEIEDMLNDALGWTGLGHCEGGDIGSGSMNISCVVVDPTIAVMHIVKELRTNGRIEGALVIITSKYEDKVVWPENRQSSTLAHAQRSRVTESKASKNTFSMRAQIGGPDYSATAQHQEQQLRNAFNQWTGDYSPDVTEFAFLLRIDGSIHRYTEMWRIRGAQKAKRKRDWIEVEIGIPEEWWRQTTHEQYKRRLAEEVESGFRSMIEVLQAKKRPIDAERLLEDWARIKAGYLRTNT